MMLDSHDIISRSQHFFPHAAERRKKLISNLKLAHYTSAEVALSIIKYKQIWLRRATAMNDFREIEYGRDVLINTMKSKPGNLYQNYINNFYKSTEFNLEEMVHEAYNHAISNTYISCFSEHSHKEDETGRLSMWRAYGGQTGVALILKTDPFKTKKPVGVISIPVTYPEQSDLTFAINEKINDLDNDLEYYKNIGPDGFKKILSEALRISVISTKHRGFEEELEWRIIHEPRLDNSGRNKVEIKSVRGTPQKVVMHTFDDFPGDNDEKLSLSDIIDKIIIGPTYHPEIIHDAFVSLLAEEKFHNPEQCVIKSDIPLRYY